MAAVNRGDGLPSTGMLLRMAAASGADVTTKKLAFVELKRRLVENTKEIPQFAGAAVGGKLEPSERGILLVAIAELLRDGSLRVAPGKVDMPSVVERYDDNRSLHLLNVDFNGQHVRVVSTEALVLSVIHKKGGERVAMPLVFTALFGEYPSPYGLRTPLYNAARRLLKSGFLINEKEDGKVGIAVYSISDKGTWLMRLIEESGMLDRLVEHERIRTQRYPGSVLVWDVPI